MKTIVAAFYNEPILFITVLTAGAVALSAEGVISTWIAALIVAVAAPIQRRFVSPARN